MMTKERETKTRSFTIHMAEDDPADRFITKQAFLELGCFGGLHFVEDRAELMHYLCRSGRHTDPLLSPRLALILLDLNMPRKDGRKALVEIKNAPNLRNIPVAMWTTSKEL